MPSVEGSEQSEQIRQLRILTDFFWLAADRRQQRPSDHWRPGLRVTPLRYLSNESGGAVSTVKVGDRAGVNSMVRGSSTRVVLFLP